MQANDNPLIFIVEENPTYNKLISSHLSANMFKRIETFENGEECLKNLYKKPDVVIQDYYMHGISSIDVLKESKRVNPGTEFVFLSATESLDIAVNANKYGAYDYVIKDQFALNILVNKINKIVYYQQLRRSNKRYKVGFALLFIALASIIVSVMGLGKVFPKS